MNELISREALKKALQNREECKECTDIDCLHCFYDIIDNAPTVFQDGFVLDYQIENARHKGYDAGYTQARKDAQPTGEWVRNRTNDRIVCSKCRQIALGEGVVLRWSNYCPWCGAKMLNAKRRREE